MNKFRFTLNVMAIAIFTFAFASMAQAQATRTWVSGVGDDVNPCSRTAPCKTFAGAISKTADGGEINVIDPGGFGAVNITKGMTIDGAGTHASILASATNGVIINDTTNTKVITLRNLSINGGTPSQPGLIGVKIFTGRAVNIENCQVFNFLSATAGAGRGISDQRTISTGILSVQHVVVRNNSANGIAILGPVKASLDHVLVTGTTGASAAIAVSTGAKVTFSNSVSAENVGIGFFVQDANSELNIESSVAANNATGVQAASSGTARLSNVHITGNGTGISFAGGTMNTYGNNKIGGNGAGNGPFAGGSLINPQ